MISLEQFGLSFSLCLAWSNLCILSNQQRMEVVYFDHPLSLFPLCSAEVDSGVVPKPCSMCMCCIGLGWLLITELCSGTADSTLQERCGHNWGWTDEVNTSYSSAGSYTTRALHTRMRGSPHVSRPMWLPSGTTVVLFTCSEGLGTNLSNCFLC